MYKRVLSIVLALVLTLPCLSKAAAVTDSEDGTLIENQIESSLLTSDIQEEVGLIEDIDPDEGISPTSVYDDYPLTDYQILWVSGTIVDPEGKHIPYQESCNVNSQAANNHTSYVTKYYYDRTQPITVAVYKVGYGYDTGFESTGPNYSSTTQSYALTVNASGGATSFRSETKLYNINSDISEISIELMARQKNTTTVEWLWTRNLTILLYDDRAAAPTTPRFVYDSSNPDQYILTGVDESMEYRLASNGRWTACAGDNIPFSIPAANTEYWIRYRAKDGNQESQFATIVLPTRRTGPGAAVNWVDESFKNWTTGMEYAFGDGEYTPVTDEIIAAGVAPFLNTVEGPDAVALKVRYVATETQPASKTTTIQLYPRAATPDETAFSLDTNTYILSGVSSTMQYKGPDDTAWKSITGTSLNLSTYSQSNGAVEILIRTKSTTKNAVSHSVSIILPPLAPAPTSLRLDYANEKITGFLPNVTYQYKIGTAAWKNISLTNQEYSVTSLITSAARELSIRVAGTETTQLSDAWTVTLPARQAAPTCSFVYNDPSHAGSAVLTGLTVGMEYQRKGDTGWTTYIGREVVLPIASTSSTYYVRVAATGTSFASANKTLTLAAPGTAPSSTLNKSTEMITISSTMEYKVDNGVYMTLPAGTTTLLATEYINALSGSETCTITVRYAATATKPASKEKVITLVARRAAPTTVQFNAETQMISGATTSMQYRVLGTDTWKSVTKTSFSIASLLEGESNVVLEFRYKSTTSLVASYTVLVNCY